MRHRSPTLLVALLLAPAVRAQPAAGPATGARFAVGVALRVSPSTLKESFLGATGALVPINASGQVAVGEQTLEAYAAAARRLVRLDPGAGAALVVELSRHDLSVDSRGWFAWVEHELVLRDGATEVARWRMRGEGRVEGLGEGAVPAAFRRAAEYAAATFEAAFVSEPAVVDWLGRRGIAVDPALAASLGAPPRLVPPTPPVAPRRGSRLLFAELGASVVRAGAWTATGPSVRAGWTGDLALFQVALDAWPGRFVARPPEAWGSASGSLTTFALGLDAAAWTRVGSRLEVHAGAGPQLVLGLASARFRSLAAPGEVTEKSTTGAALAGGAFGALRVNGVVPWTTIRYRAGAEVRGRLSGRMSLGGFGRSLPGPDLSAGLFLGLEVPRRVASPGQ